MSGIHEYVDCQIGTKSFINETMIRKFTLLTAIFASSLASFAATDLGEIQAGVEYEYPPFQPVSAVFHVPDDGESRMKTYCITGDFVYAFADAAHTKDIPSKNFYYGPNGSKVLTYDVKDVDTIYFYNSFPVDAGKFMVVWGDEPVSIDVLTPAPSEEVPMSLASNYALNIAFNMPVDFTKCMLETEGHSMQVYPESIDRNITLSWFSYLMGWFREGIIKEGSEITVTFTGLRDHDNAGNRPNFGDGAGKLVLKYRMADKPAEVVKAVNTPTSGMTDFLSYYLPGSGNGIVSLTFDRDLLQLDSYPEFEGVQQSPVVVISYGDLDKVDFEMYYENPPFEIDGNTFKVDLEGKSRLAQDMVPGLDKQQYIGLRITGIRSADGQYVWTGESSSPYSFGLSYNFREVVYNIAADWYPLVGKPLQPGDEMEIWVMNGTQILFDSVDFTYTRAGEETVASVPFADVTAEKDPFDASAMIYTLTAPEMTPDADTDIIVTFGGLLCGDGQNHDSDIRAKYKAVAAGVDEISILPADGAVYDLQGRRVNPESLAPGVYVRDGKKIMITL